MLWSLSQSFLKRHLGYFHFLAIVNSVFMNVNVQIFL